MRFLAVLALGLLAGCASADSMRLDSVAMEPGLHKGSLVTLARVGNVSDVDTLVERGAARFGKAGDVIVFHAGGDGAKAPAVHRAVAYAVIAQDAGSATYRVRWSQAAPCEGGASKDPDDPTWCVYDARGIYAPSVPIQGPGSTAEDPVPLRPDSSGFITKGDNDTTNRVTDQLAGLSPPVQVGWIVGKVVKTS